MRKEAIRADSTCSPHLAWHSNQRLQNTGAGAHLDGCVLTCVARADDSRLFASSVAGLSDMIGILKDVASETALGWPPYHPEGVTKPEMLPLASIFDKRCVLQQATASKSVSGRRRRRDADTTQRPLCGEHTALGKASCRVSAFTYSLACRGAPAPTVGRWKNDAPSTAKRRIAVRTRERRARGTETFPDSAKRAARSAE